MKKGVMVEFQKKQGGHTHMKQTRFLRNDFNPLTPGTSATSKDGYRSEKAVGREMISRSLEGKEKIDSCVLALNGKKHMISHVDLIPKAFAGIRYAPSFPDSRNTPHGYTKMTTNLMLRTLL